MKKESLYWELAFVYNQDDWPQLDDFLIKIPFWCACPICSELFKDPVEWYKCKHTFCRNCLERIVNYGNRECPLCRQNIPNEMSLDEFKANKKVKEAILLLPVRCRWSLTSHLKKERKNIKSLREDNESLREEENESRAIPIFPNVSSSPSLSSSSFSNSFQASQVLIKSSGSSWSGSPLISSLEDFMKEMPEPVWVSREDNEACQYICTLSTFSNHLLFCEHTPVRCLFPGCRIVLPFLYIKSHQLECPFRPSKCPHCKIDLIFSSLASHFVSCPQFVITCSCGLTMTNEEHSLHKMNTCPLEIVVCPHHVYGCNYSSSRNTIHLHLENCHYEAVKGFIIQTENKFSEYDKTIERLENSIIYLKSMIHQQNKYSNSSHASHYSQSHNQNLNILNSSQPYNQNLNIPNSSQPQPSNHSDFYKNNYKSQCSSNASHYPTNSNIGKNFDDDDDSNDEDSFSMYYW